MSRYSPFLLVLFLALGCGSKGTTPSGQPGTVPGSHTGPSAAPQAQPPSPATGSPAGGDVASKVKGSWKLVQGGKLPPGSELNFLGGEVSLCKKDPAGNQIIMLGGPYRVEGNHIIITGKESDPEHPFGGKDKDVTKTWTVKEATSQKLVIDDNGEVREYAKE